MNIWELFVRARFSEKLKNLSSFYEIEESLKVWEKMFSWGIASWIKDPYVYEKPKLFEESEDSHYSDESSSSGME